MKKFIFIMPLMAISSLVNCNKGIDLGDPMPLDECSWEKISQVSTAGKASEWFKVGSTKKVQLKHQDLNNNGTIDEGEIYQTVRIIGFNHDVDKNDNKIGITFEFTDLISDENGYSLTTYWNDTATEEDSNYNYKDSSLHKVLSGSGDINWFRYYGKGEDTKGTGKNRHFAKEEQYKKSILNMLPDELTKDGILKTTSKYININDGDGWKEEIVNDKLFLLSPFEMGKNERSKFEEPHTITYSYYEGAEDSKRIKKQVIGNKEARADYVYGADLDGKCNKDDKKTYAGFNNNNERYGGYSWLRSPDTSTSFLAWCVHPTGAIKDYYHVVYYNALAVAPAFCI